MARRKHPSTHGLLVVDKPAGITSHDVVAQARRRFGERQVGHAGTLDPDATGVLLVGVGKATKLLRFLTALGKTYRGRIVLGTTTDSLDSTGVVTGTFDMPGITIESARAAIDGHLTGPILQVPPMVSAVRVDGRRLHELAREGIEVARAPRPVTVYSFSVEATPDPMVLDATVRCSQGTYIRTLADDLGRLLGGGAHLDGLRRIAVGSFTDTVAGDVDSAPLLTLREAMRDYPTITVGGEVEALIRNGRVLPDDGFAGDGPWAVVGPDGDLLAMYERHDLVTVKPAVMVALPAA